MQEKYLDHGRCCPKQVVSIFCITWLQNTVATYGLQDMQFDTVKNNSSLRGKNAQTYRLQDILPPTADLGRVAHQRYYMQWMYLPDPSCTYLQNYYETIWYSVQTGYEFWKQGVTRD